MCVTYIYSHAEVMPVACGTDILDVIRAWLELLMGRVKGKQTVTYTHTYKSHGLFADSRCQ